MDIKEELFKSILKQLNNATTDIDASVIMTTDGLTIASALTEAMDEDRVAAMSAAMLSLGGRVAIELSRGELDQVIVKGELGYVVMTHAGNGLVITTITKSNTKLGLVFIHIARTVERIQNACSKQGQAL